MRKVIDGVLTILEASVNDVADTLFQFEAPPGALLVRAGGAITQTRPGGLDHLDNLAEWIQRHGLPQERRNRYSRYPAVGRSFRTDARGVSGVAAPVEAETERATPTRRDGDQCDASE